VRIHKK